MNLPLTLLLTLTLTSTALAHSGRTNSEGCHHNRRTGDYHCHNSGSESGERHSPPDVWHRPRTIVLPDLPADTVKATVLRVLDGDTIEVNMDGQTTRVRLACIDAPEIDQEPWGQQAKEALAKIIPVGQAVSLRIADTDRYGRKVAEIYSEYYFAADLPLTNEIVNLLMLYFGQAVVYNKYLNSCPETRDRYQKAERFARDARLGFWNQASPVMPWDWRAR